jgi:small subunit ribosomal protein S1
VKADGANAEQGDSLDFKVLEFSKDDKRIVLSHTKTFSEVAEDAAAPADAKKKKPAAAAKGAKAGAAPKTPAVEKSTLGDIEALSNLKDSMEGKK